MRSGGSMCSRGMIALLLALASGGGIAQTPDCRRQPQHEAWLQAHAQRWRQRLMSQPGYERPEVFSVCHLAQGNPYVDYDRDRIYLRRISAGEDALSLAHEYLHLAFKHHPLARDERFIEHTARQLLNPDAVESAL